MAVNFQRRNVGVLADIPTFEDVGRSSFRDYVTEGTDTGAINAGAMIREETTAPEETAPAAPAAPTGQVTPQAMAEYEAAQRAYLAQMEQAALRQKKAASSPFNLFGAVLGTPVRLLGNVLGGQNDLAAPFTPKQNAQDRYTAAMANIGAQKLALAQKIDSINAGFAKTLTETMTNKGELVDGLRDRLANAAVNAGQGVGDSYLMFERTKNTLMQHPLYGPLMREYGYDEMPWSPTLARELAQGKDVLSRLDTIEQNSRPDPMKSQWLADRIAAASALYPDIPVSELASNTDLLLSGPVSAQYNKDLAERGGIVAEETARGRRKGAPPVGRSGGGGGGKAGKPNVSGMSTSDLLKQAGL